MEEIWKDIPWYEWLYQVSNFGRVKSFKNGRHWVWKERILKTLRCKCYQRVRLFNDLLGKQYLVHRLVAQSFIPNYENKPLVCHIKEDLDENWTLYNWADNLFWWTHQENSQDRDIKWRSNCIFNIKHSCKWKFWKDNFNSKKIDQYSKEWEFIKQWDSFSDVHRELWISISSISQSCSMKRKSAWWFIWKYS